MIVTHVLRHILNARLLTNWLPVPFPPHQPPYPAPANFSACDGRFDWSWENCYQTSPVVASTISLAVSAFERMSSGHCDPVSCDGEERWGPESTRGLLAFCNNPRHPCSPEVTECACCNGWRDQQRDGKTKGWRTPVTRPNNDPEAVARGPVVLDCQEHGPAKDHVVPQSSPAAHHGSRRTLLRRKSAWPGGRWAEPVLQPALLSLVNR